MKKQKIVLLMVLLVIFACIVFASNNSYAIKTLYQLQQEYPTGSTWDQWGECLGFASYVYSSLYGIDPYDYKYEMGNPTYTLDQAQPGDIVRYKDNGHSVFILERNGNTFKVAEANYDWNNTVRWYQTKTYSDLSNGYTYLLKAPYVLGTTPPAQSALSKPTGLKVYNQKDDKTLSSNQVKLTWNEVSGAKYYKIKVFTYEDVSNGNLNNPISTIESYGNSYYLSNLENGEYYAYVYAAKYIYWEEREMTSQPVRIYFKIKPLVSIDVVVEGNATRVQKNRTIQLYVENIQPEDTTDSTEFTWYCSDTEYASVDQNGLVTGLKSGRYPVNIGVQTVSGKKFYKQIYVIATLATEVVTNLDYIHLKVGESAQIYATVLPDDAQYGLEFICHNTYVAEVERYTGLVTAISLGKTYVDASAVTASKRIPVYVIDYDLGDINNDGYTNITDATLILKYMKGMIEFTEDEFKRADLNFDEQVNITDYTIYTKYLKGIVEL